MTTGRDVSANHRLRSARERRTSLSGSGRPFTRRELAEAVNAYLSDTYGQDTALDESYVGRLERGEHRWPNARYREAFRAVLNARGDHELGFYAARRSRNVVAEGREPVQAPRSGPAPSDVDRPGFEPMVDVAGRLLSLRTGYANAGPVIQLAIDDLVERYEIEGPHRLLPEAVELRRRLHSASRTHERKDQLELAVFAAQTSALLAYMAVNLSRFRHAQAYSLEAFALASAVGDRGLMAWVRGTQSFAAYYQQDYQEAVRYAQDGMVHAGDGVQAIRLAVNCAARALAHLPGRRSDALAAVAHAYRLADRLDVPEGISGCISLGPYSYGRLVANAITVHQILGEHRQVLDLTEQIEDILDSSNSSWSRSLVRLDQANALLHGPPRDVEHAVSVAAEAIGASADKPITSVVQRGTALARTTLPWKQHTAVRDLLETVRKITPAATLAGLT